MKFTRPVAVVGIGGVFPDAANIDEFWINISKGVSSSRELPPDRWPVPREFVYSADKDKPDYTYSNKGCFIEKFNINDYIDFCSIPLDYELVSQLDHLFQITLAAGFQAFNSISSKNLNRKKVSVIMGNIALPTEKSSAFSWQIMKSLFEEKLFGKVKSEFKNIHPLNRFVTGLPAGLLAAALGLGGGTYTLDAACASSLYAVEFACEELLSGRAEAVITGGVSRPDCLYTQMGFSQLQALSRNGVCSPFDRKANGLVMGEGAGMVVLKTLDNALASGDKILALIRAVGLSNDRSGNLLAPDSGGQIRAMKEACCNAGWTPDQLDLIECHGTGTPVGDAVEFSSLSKMWENHSWNQGQCVIGSVKSNIGHLLTGAGAAGLIKIVLAMQNRILPPTANFSTPSEKMDFKNSPFRVLKESEEWNRRNSHTTRKAGLNAFGFGGINAHVLLEEWDPHIYGSEENQSKINMDEEAVAVIAMDCSFGPWKSLKEFENRTVFDADHKQPSQKKNWFGIDSSPSLKKRFPAIESFRGYGIEEISVNPRSFRIPPMELKEMLPQQLIMLAVASGALENAGLSKHDHLRTGCFIGINFDMNTTNHFIRWNLRKTGKEWADELGIPTGERDNWISGLEDAVGNPLDANRVMGSLGSISASRIAREYRFGGPSITVSSEESSGLRALDLALRKLRCKDIDLALIGAVDMGGDIRSLIADSCINNCSVGSESFDTKSRQREFGEGAASLILKRLKDAENEGDHILAIIKGSGGAFGLESDHILPSRESCHNGMKAACIDAGITPEKVQHIEVTGIEDPNDNISVIEGIGLFAGDSTPTSPMIVTSSASDIGHTGAASGLASLIKSILCLNSKIITPIRNLTKPHSILMNKNRFFIPGGFQYWMRDRARGPRVSIVNGVSTDGNSISAVLQEFSNNHISTEKPSFNCSGSGIFLCGANDKFSLIEDLHNLKSFVIDNKKCTTASLCKSRISETDWENREKKSKKPLVIIADSNENLLKKIEFAIDHISGNPQEPLGFAGHAGPFKNDIFHMPENIIQDGRIAFVYPGSGNQHPGMGMKAGFCIPGILEMQDRENLFLKSQLLPQYFWDLGSNPLSSADQKQLLFGQVALGTIFTDICLTFNIHPDAIIGCSLGESSAFFATRTWKQRDEMLDRINRSSLFRRDLASPYEAVRKTWNWPLEKEIQWIVGVVDQPESAIRNALENRDKIYLLIINSPEESIIGGQREDIERLIGDMKWNFIPVEGVTAAHCEVLKPVADSYWKLHHFPVTPPDGVNFYSAALGKSYKVTDDSAADAILAMASDTINFKALIEQAYADGVRYFIEMGPGASCTRIINKVLADKTHFAMAACQHGTDEETQILRILGALVALGYPAQLEGRVDCRSKIEVDGDIHRKNNIVIPTGRTSIEIRSCSAVNGISKTIQYIDKILPTTAIHEYISKPEPKTLITNFQSAQSAGASAHEAFLRFSKNIIDEISHNINIQMSLIQAAEPGQLEEAMKSIEKVHETIHRKRLPSDQKIVKPGPVYQTSSAGFNELQITPNVEGEMPVLDRDMCMEFAIGSIAKVLGQAYEEIDSFPTRVRLPDEPLMLVDGIMKIEGDPLSLTKGRVVTRHNVKQDAWYLDGGRIPTCIAVEAGQADLFLSGYLGIDLRTRGRAVYRLLDAAITFHRPLPGPGAVINYDIHIKHFFQQGDTYLFKFEFESTIDGEPLLTMRDGCAGFFTDQELAAGRGIVHTKLDRISIPGIKPDDWKELVPMQVESYSDIQIEALRKGKLEDCFGPLFHGLNVKKPLTIPGGLMNLIHRVQVIDPDGGRYGMGIIRAEADIHPDDWFLTCHFCDDNVMPGTLMYECCMHALRILLLRMGWVAHEENAVWEPVPGVSSGLKCRGQVIHTTKKAQYEISIKELGYGPEPFAIADALMYADGRPVVEMTNMSIRLSGTDRNMLERLWQNRRDPLKNIRIEAKDRKKPIYDNDKILAFAVGKPSEAFGEHYRVFDKDRVIARLPGPPYKFLDRITMIDAKPWVMEAGGTVEAQYEIPPGEWYFSANRQKYMPFSILLEIALQPCGWMAAYMGSALTDPRDLSFRNLGGSAVQYEPITPNGGILTTRVKSTNVSSSGGMIIQHYDFEMFRAGRTVYKGNTYFGFFSKQALANQVGIRDAKIFRPDPQSIQESLSQTYPADSPFPDEMLRMIDNIEIFQPDGGPCGLGYIQGTMRVKPESWFFKAHFYQDPVIPGSLGLESMLQLMKVLAYNRWKKSENETMLTIIPGMRHDWMYRGQVIPGDRLVTVDCWVTSLDDAGGVLFADGFLSVDGRIIYQMNNFSLIMRKDPK